MYAHIRTCMLNLIVRGVSESVELKAIFVN